MSLVLLIIFILYPRSALAWDDNRADAVFDDPPDLLVLSSVNDQVRSAAGELQLPWPGFTILDRNPKPPLYGLTYFPWRTKIDCSNITRMDMENDIAMISQIASSIYIYELYCDFTYNLINLTRHYNISILLGISMENEWEFQRQRSILENIFLNSSLNLSHIVAVTVGHGKLHSSAIEISNLQVKLKNITEMVDKSDFPDIPVSTADCVDNIFHRRMCSYTQIYITPMNNNMAIRKDPLSSTMLLYEKVLQIRNRADQDDHDSSNKPIILTDIGWPSKGITKSIKRNGTENSGRIINQRDQNMFLYFLRCPRFPMPPMFYVHSAFDLTWKLAGDNESSKYWGLADAVSRKWKPGVLQALTMPCINSGSPQFDNEIQHETRKFGSPVFIGVGAALIVIFIIMLGLVIVFWRWKRKAVRKLKRTQERQLELMRNISNRESNHSHYFKQVWSNNPWDDYLSMLDPDYEDLSHLVAPELRIDLSCLELEEIIGKGHFGIVQKAKNYQYGTGEDVAVKRLHVGARNAHQFLQEGIKMQKFNHPNVLNLIGISFTPTNMPLIITQYLELGDLLDYVKKPKNKSIPLRQLVNFCVQISEGMRYLHDLRVVHRDLAARNCMLDKNLVVKIADFGLCRDISDSDSYQSTKAFEFPIRWMPPEAMEKLQWNSKSDVWSYGVVIWELFSRGKQPYKNVPLIELRTYLTTGGRLEQPEGCPDVIYEIMKSCWAYDEVSRPTFVILCQCLPMVLESIKKGDLDSTDFRDRTILLIKPPDPPESLVFTYVTNNITDTTPNSNQVSPSQKKRGIIRRMTEWSVSTGKQGLEEISRTRQNSIV